MATLFRDLAGGYLVPYLTGKTNEQWQSSNTPNTNVQLTNSPTVSGPTSVLVSPGLINTTNLITNGSFESGSGFPAAWNMVTTDTNGGTAGLSSGGLVSGSGFSGSHCLQFAANASTANYGVTTQLGNLPAGTYTLQVALRNGPHPSPSPIWQIGIGDPYTAGQVGLASVTLSSVYQIFTVTVTTTAPAFLFAWVRYPGTFSSTFNDAAFMDIAMAYAGNYNQIIPYVDGHEHGLMCTTTTDGASTPHQSVFVSGTNTIDVRAQLTGNWASGSGFGIVSKQTTGGAQPRWYVGVSSGFLNAQWISGSSQSGTSTAAVSFATGSTRWLRALMAPGAGTINFYTSQDGNNWTALGTQITGLTTTALSTSGTEPPLLVNANTGGLASSEVEQVQVFIAGSKVIDVNWNQVPVGNGPWTSSTGEVWTRINNGTVDHGGSGSAYINNVAYSPTRLNFTPYDGVGFFMYCPTNQFLDHVRVRFYTEDPTTTYPSYFETDVQLIGGNTNTGTQTLYGTGLYGSAIYSVVSNTVVNWTEFIVPKQNFISVGTPTWAKITRTEVTPFTLAGGLAAVYIDAISGWVNPAPEDSSANRIMNRLPNFYWDTDYYRQLCQELGYEIDCLKATARYGLDQRFVDFAEWGLRLWESQYNLPVEPVASFGKRRALVKMLFAQPGSKADFIQYLSAIADGGVQIQELYANYSVLVSASVNQTSTRNQLVLALSRTIPAHLQVSVTYNAFVAGVGVAGSGLGPAYFAATGESASFVDTATKS